MKFRFLISAISVCAVIASCQSNSTQTDHTQHADSSMNMADPTAIPDSVPGSPRVAAMANIGSAHVHIDYSTPAARGRIIWGGLVPFNEIWVTGAHDATSINFPVDVTINGNTVPAGKYAFFTIPGETEWILILNKNWEQHLTRNYSEADDVLRWTVTPTIVEHTERLRYDVISTGENTGRITMTWDRVQIGFDFSI
jgi:hypothetical protein